MHRKIAWFFYCVIAVVLCEALALGLMYFVEKYALLPAGSDTFYHIYRGQFVLNNMMDGNLYPSYDAAINGGVEILRYGAPLPVYIFAACEALARLFADYTMASYVIFVGLVFFAGAIVWFIIGVKIKRHILGLIIGVLWFFMPNNLYMLFSEGNLSLSVAMVFLPLLLFGIYEFFKTRKVRFLLLTSIFFALLFLCDLYFSVIVGGILLIFLIVDMIVSKRFGDNMRILFSLVLGAGLVGIQWIPSVFGAVESAHSIEGMGSGYADILSMINPLNRLSEGGDVFYFGLAAAIIAIFGICFGYRKTKAGFIIALAMLALSVDVIYKFMLKIPYWDNVLMLKFTSVALCFVLMSFLQWDSLKKPFVVIFAILLAIDIIPSYGLIYANPGAEKADEQVKELEKSFLLDEARVITNQRLCYIGENQSDFARAFFASDAAEKIDLIYDSENIPSEEAANIKRLSKALSGGNYLYLFDRTLQLGSDAVLVNVQGMDEAALKKLDDGAKASGYDLYFANSDYRLYDLLGIEYEHWGLTSEFKAIAIGDEADYITMLYPTIKDSSSDNLNDYSFEELKKYDLIYLAGFKYDSKSLAEELVLKLSESGVKVVIAADSVPVETINEKQSFLGAEFKKVNFDGAFPNLLTNSGSLKVSENTDIDSWSGIYIEGLMQVEAKAEQTGNELAVCGYLKNENILVIGANLPRYLIYTKDAGIERYFASLLNIKQNALPLESIVPIKVDIKSDSILIESDYDKVNTGLSYHKSFVSDNAFYEDNNMLVADKGKTYITFEYPYLKEALICTAASACALAVFMMLANLRISTQTEEELTDENLENADDKPKEETGDDEIIEID